MVFLLTLLTSAGLFVVGVLLLTHSFQLTQLIGYNSLAERYLGTGGTYTMWKLLGIALMLGAVWYLVK